MQFMVMHYSSEANEAGTPPTPELIEAVDSYITEVASSGALVSGVGLGPSSQGARLEIDAKGKATVTDGPFAKARELIAGFAILEVASKEEAIEHAKRWADVAEVTRVDVRPVYA